jgi:LysR family hydrogen peroxide-inducible transcriptional activator
MSFAGLSLRDLEYIVAVGESRHFGRAAERCNVSQPALSAQVRKVEAALGITIFERKRGGALVTKPGQAVIARAQMVLAEARALLATAKSDTQVLAGPFRLGSIPTIGPYVLPHALKPLRKAFPDVRLVLHEGRIAELIAMLRAGDLDAVMACAPIAEKGFAVERLFYEPFFIMHQPGHAPLWPQFSAEQEVVLLQERLPPVDRWCCAPCGTRPGSTCCATWWRPARASR